MVTYFTRVFWVAKIVAKIIGTRMLHPFCNRSCKIYIGTDTHTDTRVCIMTRDHGIYNGSGQFFMISRLTFATEVARIVAKRVGFLQLCNSRVT